MESIHFVVIVLCLTTIQGFIYMEPQRDYDKKCIYNGGDGVCLYPNECPQVYIKELNYSYICEYRNFTPIFCCPTSLTEPFQQEDTHLRKAELMCKRYAMELFLTDKMEEVHMDNELLQKMPQSLYEFSFPYMVMIGFINKQKEEMWICGGTLIAPQFVLTSTHCRSENYPISMVRMSRDNVGMFRDIQDFIYYDNSSGAHDIMILKLKEPVEFTLKIRPACLSTKEKLPTGVIVSGWGMSERSVFKSPKKQTLMAVYLPILSLDDCREYQLISKKNIYMDRTLCCGVIDRIETTCMGDSGGPLAIAMRPLSAIVGIVSKGIGNCAETESPTICIRISYYLDWIERVVWP